jgi:hypothetical protein
MQFESKLQPHFSGEGLIRPSDSRQVHTGRLPGTNLRHPARFFSTVVEAWSPQASNPRTRSRELVTVFLAGFRLELVVASFIRSTKLIVQISFL